MPRSLASAHLKKVIRKSGIPLRQIAKEARIDRNALTRWYRGKQKSIKLDHAERVMMVLTGKGFTR